MVFDIFAFAAWSLLEPILDRFWLHFGLPNRLKIDPKSVLNGIKLQCRFWTPSGTVEESISAPAWPQIDPNLTPKTTPDGIQRRVPSPWSDWRTSQNRTRNRSSINLALRSRSRTIFDPNLGRFWVDFGLIFGWLMVDFGWYLVFVISATLTR